MSSHSDRNLLLGILALQMDFISREQLIAATNAWITEKSRPLDQILLAQESLDADTHALLVALVEKHLELHGGDAGKSLAAVSSLGSVRDELNRLGDGEIEASMSLVGNGHDAVDPYATEVPSERAGSSAGMRFRVLRPHAKGGLGEVFVARDDQLNREVALKEIQTQYAHDIDSRSRFTLEAEVTGGLEHPGIVPVYGLGHYGDGRPYYAMRLIRGDSLAEAINRFHGQDKADAPTQEPIGYDSVEFRKLLGRFVDVCNAIQYAHSRGVLHRDLKPGNIMLGKYGETLVVDWGLAKLQGRNDESKVAGESTLQPRSGSVGTPTQDGHALGTPAYMPPEQAAGQLNDLGPESDVYSLGATLYHLLTGRPPVTGSDIGPLLKKVQQGDFPAPCEVTPRVPKTLDAICRRAMATRPRDRYVSPQELADDVERFLADEPVAAYVEPLIDRAHRWVRKHRTVAVTTAAVVLLSAIGLGVFSTIVTGKNAELAESTQREIDARRRAETNEELARLHGELTFATLASVVNDIQGGLKQLPGGGEVRRRLLKTSLEKLENIVTTNIEPGKADHQRIWALLELGDVVLQFGIEDAQVPILDEPPALEGEADQQLQQSAVELASTLYRRAHTIALKLVAEDPGGQQARLDLAATFNRLGDVQLQAGKPGEALAAFRQGLKITDELAANDPDNTRVRRELYASYHRLGFVQLGSGKTGEALASYQKCVEIAEQLVAEDPADTQVKRFQSISYDLLGDAQLKQGDSVAAIDLYQKSLALKETLLNDSSGDAETRRDLFISYNKFAKVQLELGQLSEARRSCRKSLEIALELAASDPNDVRAQRDLSYSYSRIGDVHLQSGQLSDALAAYRASLEIDQTSAKVDPNDARALLDLTDSHYKLGRLYQQMGDYRAAAGEYEAGVVIVRRMIDQGMNVESAKQFLASLEKAVASAAKANVALGDWASLLDQPAETLPALLVLRAAEFVKRARFSEAAEAAEKLRTLPNASARQLYEAAQVFGHCAASIKAETGEVLSAEQSKQRERYLAKKVAAMKQAIIMGAIQFGRPLSANPGTGQVP